MTTIDASGKLYSDLNEEIRAVPGDVTLVGVCGQRFIGAGRETGTFTIKGVPGNALGAYLDGAKIEVFANAQDAVGDTMNEGEIIVHGNIGDAAGYAMRGGKILVEGDSGYRAGIHMKAYKEKSPVLVIGGCAGSFLGEYQAGGVIAVFGLGDAEKPIVGEFPFTGMHGGKVYLRSDGEGIEYPKNVTAAPADENDLAEIRKLAKEYVAAFGGDEEFLMDSPFTVIVPDSKNPYKRMYVPN